jgi:hypothetical protein
MIILTFVRQIVLTRYMSKAKIRKVKNLLSGEDDDVEQEVR